MKILVDRYRRFDVEESSLAKSLIESFGPKFADDILGVVLYGSRCYGLASSDSDFDFFLIMKDGSQFTNKKGVQRVNDIPFKFNGDIGKFSLEADYSTSSVNDIKRNIKNFAAIGDYYLYSTLCRGKLIYSKDNDFTNEFIDTTAKIKDAYAETYGNSRLSEDKVIAERVAIKNALKRINSIHHDSRLNSIYYDSLFNTAKFLYFNLVEKIRNYYCNLNGYPFVQTTRTDRVYGDERYRKSIFGDVKVADEEFMRLYLRCISEYRNEEEIMDYLTKNGYLSSNSFLRSDFEGIVKDLKKKPKSFEQMVDCINDLFNYVTKDMKKIELDGSISFQYTKINSDTWY